MSIKILYTAQNLHPAACDLLNKKNYYLFTIDPYSPPEKIVNLVKKNNIEAIITRVNKITRELFVENPQLRVVVKHGLGVDDIDVKAATEMNIPVLTTTPYANCQSVAEHTVGLMYSLTKSIVYLDSTLRSGKWVKNRHANIEIFGKCLALIGIGRISRNVVELVKPLKMKIIAYDPFVLKDNFPKGVEKFDSLKELFKMADFVSIHCPLNSDTFGLIDWSQIKEMKKSAYIINTSRGGVIKEEDLIRALKEKRIAGAGIDSYTVEPLSPDSPLLKLSNVTLTPHVGGLTKTYLRRAAIDAVEKVFNVIEGNIEKIEKGSIVNPSVFFK